jgi:hypothetical protein
MKTATASLDAKVYACGPTALIVLTYGPTVLFQFRVNKAGAHCLIQRLEEAFLS